MPKKKIREREDLVQEDLVKSQKFYDSYFNYYSGYLMKRNFVAQHVL